MQAKGSDWNGTYFSQAVSLSSSSSFSDRERLPPKHFEDDDEDDDEDESALTAAERPKVGAIRFRLLLAIWDQPGKR